MRRASGLVQNRAEGALQAVDQAGKLLGIDEVEICTGLEIANRNLQSLEFASHGENTKQTYEMPALTATNSIQKRLQADPHTLLTVFRLDIAALI